MAESYELLPDNELVNLLKSSKKDSEMAFKVLYKRYAPIVNAYCMRVLNNKSDAEDIFQETFTRFYENVRPDHSSNNIIGFLIRIARNLCLNHKRNKREYISIEDYELNNQPNQDYEKKELLELITMALNLIDFEYREAFVLREYNDLSYSEIADICNISEINAKSRVFRAKQKIKNILMPYLKDISESNFR